MAGSPFKGLYCTVRRGLVAALLIAASVLATAQGSGRSISKGPRAVGLLEFDDKKQVHLVPVVVMVNGEFYGAGEYKATPVPMALEPQTVYEGVRTGASQGLFTITRAHQVLGVWTGEGIWEPTELAPKRKPTPLAPVEEKEGPPVLRRHGADSSKPAPPPPPAPTPEKETQTVKLGKPDNKEAMEPGDRPTLRRGKPEKTDSTPILDSKVTTAWATVTTIPAVSDAKPETPRSYHFVLRPQEEQDLRTQVEAMAAKELRKHLNEPAETAPRRGPKSGKTAPDQLKFDNVQFEAVDPSTNNEPVYILAADTTVPDKVFHKDVPYHVLLAVRQDIYSEMHVLLSGISDPEHLDLQPRYDFIDVVDADGDGYGELLFRRSYDSGRAFALYRVIGNQLWPLFEGKP